MPWVYELRTGRLTVDGIVVGIGYSGHGDGKNNPSMQHVPNVGPIPVGEYTIGKEFTHPQKGPVCMRLTPGKENLMYGRAGFMIHGDSIRFPGTASEGCIILGKTVRLQVAVADDRDLLVVKGQMPVLAALPTEPPAT